MHDSRFLNLHLLYTASYANQNRDESGMPKSLTYGGTNRNRWSSQAMTRPKRLGYENEAAWRPDQLPRERRHDHPNPHLRPRTRRAHRCSAHRGRNHPGADPGGPGRQQPRHQPRESCSGQEKTCQQDQENSS